MAEAAIRDPWDERASPLRAGRLVHRASAARARERAATAAQI
jgi:hypothetical protein